MNEEIQKLLKSSFSGFITLGITHGMITPIDLIKCRMQTGGYKYPTLFNGINEIIKGNGITGIYKGIIPTILGYSIYGFLKFGTFEAITHMTKDGKNHFSPIYAIFISELVSSFALCPFESIKVRVQTNPNFSHNLFSCIKKIYLEEYYYGFFKSYIPLVLRQLPFTILQFTTYEEIFKKFQTKKDKYFEYSIAFGFLYGITCIFLTNPSDIIVSKVNRVNKTPDEIIPKIGWRNYMKGFKQRLIMMGILISLQMNIYNILINL